MENKKIIGILLGVILTLLCGCFYLWQVVPQNESFEDKNLVEDNEIKLSKENKQDYRKETEKEPQEVYIYICGQVKKAGVYKFENEPRLIEVVNKAGGFKKNADKKALNLAKCIPDGTQIEIIKKGTKKKKNIIDSKSSNSSYEGYNQDDGKIDINTASKEDLMKISGVGEARANQIISYREKNGNFKAIEDIKNISGIKDGIYGRIKDSIKV